MPAWNEADVIAGTVHEVLQTVPEVDLLVINDGSTDDTAAIARAAGATVISLPYNMGVGAALRTGYKYAWRSGYDQAIQVDADGQHDPNDIPRVLAGLQDADISIGARFAGEGNYRAKGPRRWAMLLLAGAMSQASGTKLTDVTSGFRAANRRTIGQYTRHYPAEYLGDTVDSLMTAIRMGHSVTQVPVAMRPRQGGTPSASPWKAAVYLLRSLFALLIASTRRRERRSLDRSQDAA
ncbi:glycosyltransferase family 2 protein [Propioniciclava coleopterorum]|uniref:Glycosyltransferase family 2 protein n=2 Tax=Propioniciclava coleopterorum TaxID=2714937 RepID=A0A6G7YAG2_9ACTN|nr:glycosyltransferase family 2 protein [Propioniciclava coleopterorum]